jgi:hypothetical protein
VPRARYNDEKPTAGNFAKAQMTYGGGGQSKFQNVTVAQ